MQRLLLAIAFHPCGSSSSKLVDAPPDIMVDSPTVDAAEPELLDLTADHNLIRAAVDTTRTTQGPLPNMQWDPNLAALAASWVKQCQSTNGQGIIDHSPTEMRENVDGYAYIGENLFASNTPMAPGFPVTTWASESANYDYPSNTCTPENSCYHYLQIVWRTSVNVGCATFNCAPLFYSYTTLCEYGPGGSIVGESPY